MQIRRSGFTMVELVIVVAIGAVVLSIGTRQYSRVANQRSVGNARDAVIMTAYRARAEAMRSGKIVYLRIDPAIGLVRVDTAAAAIPLHAVSMNDFGTTMTGNAVAVCYTARGYALPGCTNITANTTVAIHRGIDSTSVVVMPLGQVRRAQ